MRLAAYQHKQRIPIVTKNLRGLLSISAIAVALAFVPAANAQDKMGKDGMAKDTMSKDAMSKDGMKKNDAMSKDAMKKGDAMSKDAMKK